MIGKGLSNKKTNVPDLKELSLEKAEQTCLNTSLNIGAIICDSTIVTAEDSATAFVWKQRPEAEDGTRLFLGSSIDIWISLDSAKILPDSLAIELLQSGLETDSIISDDSNE